ncbi:hypothetical protein DFJ74DRAFT_713723 [Hyaloraphidium curvatum]|nr:hypothetical protein DFJ74DRAFT_713723 [Hyaloraphidium curvatum]
MNAAAGSCVAAWQLVYLGFVLCWSFAELGIYASANAQIAAVQRLYADARGEIRALAARIAADPDPALCALRRQLAAHDAVLEWSTGEAEKAGAKMFGFPITGGVIRGLLITLFTLGVGLWTVLRGLGIFLTVETMCPLRA